MVTIETLIDWCMQVCLYTVCVCMFYLSILSMLILCTLCIVYTCMSTHITVCKKCACVPVCMRACVCVCVCVVCACVCMYPSRVWVKISTGREPHVKISVSLTRQPKPIVFYFP